MKQEMQEDVIVFTTVRYFLLWQDVKLMLDKLDPHRLHSNLYMNATFPSWPW